MTWTQLPLGPIQTNAYVLANADNEALIFDPGGDGPELIQWIKEKQLEPKAILLTHAHFDHIGAVDEVRETFSIPVYLHQSEKDWLGDPELNRSSAFLGRTHITAKPADHLITKEQTLDIGSFSCKVLETPGHSPGSISFYFEEEKIVFSGDALFAGSIGRTDLPEGDHQLLLTSIDQKLMDLPEETIVACGHGPSTTIGVEMDSNPFLNAL
ncbi:MBL fold metallo-hydrolase [Alkalicoccobacillus porphyridii]|uniref:MBL fold metallo-hydrolase n=1 Tax=Alkalicoccobacillus porphyridii TaxID=2597270 RepID=A0A553ZTC1_9BACI|nr:MBL fold metallo-hydrolase [Alkalicoccobacillus porphyridii]TSB44719.1 MBL fold metallo-hydrolase [Alkalicoccobacillus porphyridii]